MLTFEQEFAAFIVMALVIVALAIYAVHVATRDHTPAAPSRSHRDARPTPPAHRVHRPMTAPRGHLTAAPATPRTGRARHAVGTPPPPEGVPTAPILNGYRSRS